MQNQGQNQFPFPKNTEKILCSVCVATFQRQELLEKLLKSLENQNLPESVDLEIIIVDNDKNKSALPIVNKFKESSRICFHYFNQPIKNISITRNVSVEKASGDYLLFIDDDEKASSNWIANLLKTLKDYNADGVIGKMVPEFHENIPQWVRQDNFYYSPMGTTGTKAKFLYAGNCLIKAIWLKNKKGPFDVNYGLTGSEDAHLFEILASEGAVFVNCLEAVVSEFIPLERTIQKYFFVRGIRGGNGHTRRVLETTKKNSFLVRFLMLVKALIFGTTSFIFMIILFQKKVFRTKWMIKVGSNFGRFLAVLGLHYKGYQ